jgi:hypothetical protein
MEPQIDNTLVSFGSELKSLGETADSWRVGGWLVVFDSADISSLRDRFTKSTDFDIQDGDRRSIYYNHGLDSTIKRTKIGNSQLFIKDAGVWMEGEIKKRKDYLSQHVEKIADGVKNGVFGLSSGAPAHLVERKKLDDGHEIELWPLAEASITPTPAEPLTSCVSLKSLVEIEEQDAIDEIKKWNEAEHPRDDDGKFRHGGSGDSFQWKPDTVQRDVTFSKLPGYHHQLFADVTNAARERFSQDGQFHIVQAVQDELAHRMAPEDFKSPAQIGLFLPEARSAAREFVSTQLAQRGTPSFKPEQSNITIPKPRPLSEQLASGQISQSLHDSIVRSQQIEKDRAQQIRATGKAPAGKVATVQDRWGEHIVADEKTQMAKLYNSKAQAEAAAEKFAAQGIHVRVINRAITNKYSLVVPEEHRHPLATGRKSIEGEADEITELKEQETACKSDAPQLVSLRDELREGIPFDIHSGKVLAAVSEFAERADNFIELRCVKSGRVLSAEKHSRLSSFCDAVESHLRELRELLDAHDPAARSVDADDANALNGAAEAATKSITQTEARQAMALYAATMARLNGVLINV